MILWLRRAAWGRARVVRAESPAKAIFSDTFCETIRDHEGAISGTIPDRRPSVHLANLGGDRIGQRTFPVGSSLSLFGTGDL